jgi:hypothetical protein
MICPKCGFEQPESPECMRCGIVISRYKGPVVGGSPVPPAQMGGYPPPRPASMPPPPPQFGNETVRLSTFPPPAPAPVMNAVGTVYGDPVPAVAGGGTVYSGPISGQVISGTTRAVSPQQKLRPGLLLNEAFTIYFKNFIPFLVLTSVAFAPVFLLGAFLSDAITTQSAAFAGGAGLMILLSLILCVPLSTGAITYGVFQQMRGGETSIGACLRVGLSSMLPVLGVAFLLILLIFGVIVVTAIPVSFVIGLAGAAAARGAGPEAGMGCTLLLIPLVLLCYVPAVMVYLKYFVAVPAAVEERPGVLNALRRSAFLTEGQRGPIFGVLFLLGFINVGLGLVFAFLPVVGTFLGTIFNLVMTGVFATACAVVYYRLRSLKESIDVDQISSVFS